MEAFLVLVLFLFFGLPILRDVFRDSGTSVADSAIGGVADRRRALRRVENERRLKKEAACGAKKTRRARASSGC